MSIVTQKIIKLNILSFKILQNTYLKDIKNKTNEHPPRQQNIKPNRAEIQYWNVLEHSSFSCFVEHGFSKEFID